MWADCHRVVAALGVAAAFAVLIPASSAAALSWSAPVLIAHGATTADEVDVSAVDCPSRSLCVAFGNNTVIVSRRPDRPGAWSRPRPVFPSNDETSVSCPSVSMCVAFSNSGQIAATARPASGSWRLAQVTRQFVAGTAISCPSVALCVGVDSAGDVISSRHPLGGASAWHVVKVEPTTPWYLFPTDVSCPSVKLCVVVDAGGNVLTSRDPTGGAGAWTSGRVDTGADAQGLPYGLWGVSCASTSACVALDRHNDVVSSRNPAAGASSWKVAHVARAPYQHISCTSASLCVAIAQHGVLWSRDPLSAHPRWTLAGFAPDGGWDDSGGISCPSVSVCVAGSASQLASTAKPTGRASAWKLRPFPFIQSIASISCPTAHLCMAVDDVGDAITSSAPGARKPRWRTFQISGPNPISSVACPSVSLCAASLQGYIFTSRHPAIGPKAWKVTEVSGGPSGLSCPSTSLCAGIAYGQMLVSTDPTGGSSAWHQYDVDHATFDCYSRYDSGPCNATVEAVACATRSFCLGVDNDGNTLTSNDPAGGPSSWTLHAAGLSLPLVNDGYYPGPFSAFVSCPSARLCVVVDSEGHVESSTNPTGDAGAWTHTDLHDPSGLTGISCRTLSFCVAIDAAGNAFTSSDPTGDAAAWKRRSIDHSIPLNAVSCASRSLCVAVDPYGYAVVGH